MLGKCLWCGKSTSQLTKIYLQFKGKTEEAEICSPACEKNYRDISRYVYAHIKHLVVALALVTLVGLIVTFWRISIDRGALGVFIISTGMGIVVIKYPFVTTETVNRMGAKKAIAFARSLGIICIILGIAFWIVLSQFIMLL